MKHFCSPQREEYHDGIVHRQEKIGKVEHRLPHHHAWPRQSNEWPKIETTSYRHVWSHQRWSGRRWSHIMSPLYTNEIETLGFNGVCCHVRHHQNKQQDDSWRQQEDLPQLWIHIPTKKSLGVTENPTEAWEFKWPANRSSSEG